MPKYITTILLFLFFYVNSVYCQDHLILGTHNDTIARLKNLIVKDQLLSTPAISFDGSPSKPFYRFAYLLSIANREELALMVSDTSRYLRIYGYIGLLYKGHPDIKKIKRVLLNDSTMIVTISGCIVETMPITKAVNDIRPWYYKKGFDRLLKEYITVDYVFGFPIKTLFVE